MRDARGAGAVAGFMISLPSTFVGESLLFPSPLFETVEKRQLRARLRAWLCLAPLPLSLRERVGERVQAGLLKRHGSKFFFCASAFAYLTAVRKPTPQPSPWSGRGHP
jgi:hypothetical protein